MDWNHQLLASLIWLGVAFVLSLIGLTLVVVVLGRFTGWGRQVRRLTWAYFDPRRGWAPLLRVVVIVFMTLFAVRVNILLSFWYNGFYSAMQQLNADMFWSMLLVFAVLATIHVGRALTTFYLRQSLAIHWRSWMTNRLMDRWVGGQAYYRSQFVAEQVDNPDQRIQQDVDGFVTTTLALSMGLLEAVVSLFSFTLILWTLSGPLTLFDVTIPRGMVFLVYLYVIAATVIAVRIGRPLVRLNFLNEQFNATFRYALIRLREYGESIAFHRGEAVEREHLGTRFARVIANMWAIVFRSLKFQGFNFVVSQTTTVFPFIVQAPRLLSKEIQLGDVMQTAQAFSQVESALSFFRTSYDDFASYRAVIDRLSGFENAVDAADRLPVAVPSAVAHRLSIDALTVRTPADAVLVRDLKLDLAPRDALLIRGPSGIGKTTLLRSLAGLWPYMQGTIGRPLGHDALFLPQKPYLPLGSLRTALHYPAAVGSGEGDEEILRACHLGHLAGRLDEAADWTRILSPGEQQRLALARVLLHRPQLVFLDEASSALDEGLEHAMYVLLRERLPETMVISVGHRSTLTAFHGRQLVLEGEGRWRVEATQPATA